MRIDLERAAILQAVNWLGEDASDERLLSDFLESETDLHSVIGRLYQIMAADQELVAGIAERETALKARKDRLANRIASTRASIAVLMRAGKQSKVELPEATFSIRDGKAKLAIVDPAAVPDEYQRVTVAPDKTKINEAFSDCDALPNWLVEQPAEDVLTVRKA